MCRQAGRFGFFVLGPRAVTPPLSTARLGVHLYEGPYLGTEWWPHPLPFPCRPFLTPVSMAPLPR